MTEQRIDTEALRASATEAIEAYGPAAWPDIRSADLLALLDLLAAAEAERDEWRQTALDERAAALDALEQIKVREAERDSARGYISELETAVRSRNDVIKHRDARIKAVRALHTGTRWPGVTDEPVCDECDLPWPCPTIRALDGDA